MSGGPEQPVVLKTGAGWKEGWFEIIHATGTVVRVRVKCDLSKSKELIVFQLNIWQEGTMIANGYEAIVDEIVRSNADFVTLSEVRNYGGVDFTARLVHSLVEKGVVYYSFRSDDSGVLSKYPVISFATVYPNESDSGAIYKLVTGIGRTRFAVYTGHLDYKHYACYLPQAYDGVSFGKLDGPVTDVAAIGKMNLDSKRDEAIGAFLAGAEKEREQGAIVLLSGGFNEPSHLDWIHATKDLYDHNGVVYNWDASLLLQQSGFIDSYRSVYPSPVSHPGFTYPSDNPGTTVEKLSWAPDADERERIDFIYYYPDVNLKLEGAELIGPSRSVVRSERVDETGEDSFIRPLGIWPSDHKGLIVRFKCLTANNFLLLCRP